MEGVGLGFGNSVLGPKQRGWGVSGSGAGGRGEGGEGGRGEGGGGGGGLEARRKMRGGKRRKGAMLFCPSVPGWRLQGSGPER